MPNTKNPTAQAMKLQYALTGTPMSLVIEALKAEFTEDTLGIIAHAINTDNDREDLRSEIEDQLRSETGDELQNREALEHLTSYFDDTAFDVQAFSTAHLAGASALLHMYAIASLIANAKERTKRV
jgi:hypothetical protein